MEKPGEKGEVKTVDALDLKFRDWLGYLRHVNHPDVDDVEEQYRQVFTELGYSEEDLMNTTLGNCNKVVELYIVGLQQVLEQLNQGFPVSIPGTYKYGKEASPDIIEKTIPIHMRRHEEYKERVARR